MFGQRLPGFNVQGKDEVQTITGGILTLIICFTVLLYGGIKLQMLLDRYNPEISEVTERSYYGADESVNLT